MNKPKVVFIPIARNTFDIGLAQEMSDKAFAVLSQLPIEIIGNSELITDLVTTQKVSQSISKTNPDLLLIFQATFADSSLVMTLANTIDTPILLWAVPEDHSGGRLRLNSFCGINLAGHALTRTGFYYKYMYMMPDNPAVLNEVLTLTKAGYARNMLRMSRLGRIGDNPEGFETCLFVSDRIRELFGMEIVQYNLENDVFSLVDQVDPNQIDTILINLKKVVIGLEELDPKGVSGTLRVYATLKQITQHQGIGGFAIRCWPEFFTDLSCAACGAMSMLSDEMIPCSCEADVNGTITQMILQSISKKPAFGTDIVSIDEGNNALVIWHCGLAPLSMADPKIQPGVTNHSNRKLPLLFDFTLMPGQVTIARLTESSGDYRLVIGRGEIVRGPKSFSGTSGLLRFDVNARDVIDLIMTEGLEHHISITYGDYVHVLVALAEMLKIPILRLTQ